MGHNEFHPTSFLLGCVGDTAPSVTPAAVARILHTEDRDDELC